MNPTTLNNWLDSAGSSKALAEILPEGCDEKLRLRVSRVVPLNALRLVAVEYLSMQEVLQLHLNDVRKLGCLAELMSPETAHHLSIQFVEHVLHLSDSDVWRQRATDAIQQKLAWIEGRCSREQLIEASDKAKLPNGSEHTETHSRYLVGSAAYFAAHPEPAIKIVASRSRSAVYWFESREGNKKAADQEAKWQLKLVCQELGVQ